MIEPTPNAPCEDCGAGPGEFCKKDCIQEGCKTPSQYKKLLPKSVRAMYEKDKRWLQPTPHLELVALCQTMEMHIFDIKEGIGDPSKHADGLLDGTEQLRTLALFLEKGSW